MLERWGLIEDVRQEAGVQFCGENPPCSPM